MASAILDDLASRLQTAGVGTVGTDIFKMTGASVPQAGSSVVLIETGGVAPDYIQSGAAVRQPGVQVTCRATTALVARQLAESVFVALGNLRNVTLGSNFYRRISTAQDVIELGRDDRGLFRFAVNLRIEVSKRA